MLREVGDVSRMEWREDELDQEREKSEGRRGDNWKDKREINEVDGRVWKKKR